MPWSQGRELSENYPEKSEKPEKVIEQDLLKSIHLDADGQPRITSRTLAKILGISHEKLVKLIEDTREELERLGPGSKTKTCHQSTSNGIRKRIHITLSPLVLHQLERKCNRTGIAPPLHYPLSVTGDSILRGHPKPAIKGHFKSGH